METIILFAAIAAMFAIRAPHIGRSLKQPVSSSRETRSDRVLVALVTLGLVLPLIAVLTPWLSFGETPQSPWRLIAGAVTLALGLVVLHRSHADLGTNWSNTLELREGHTLVTHGVYRLIRHPMYTALLLHGVGQALVLPNWLAGPSFLVPFALVVATRLRAEEQMMREAFGAEYESYAARTRRLVPYAF